MLMKFHADILIWDSFHVFVLMIQALCFTHQSKADFSQETYEIIFPIPGLSCRSNYLPRELD